MKGKEICASKERLDAARSRGLRIGVEPQAWVGTEPSLLELVDERVDVLEDDVGGNVGHVVNGQDAGVQADDVDPP